MGLNFGEGSQVIAEAETSGDDLEVCSFEFLLSTTLSYPGTCT